MAEKSSVSMRNLTAFMSSYFIVNTDSAEKETELVDEIIRDSILDVRNLTGVRFLTIFKNYTILGTIFIRISNTHYHLFVPSFMLVMLTITLPISLFRWDFSFFSTNFFSFPLYYNLHYVTSK